MSFVMIPEELLSVDLSAAQFRAIVQIMNNTYSTGKFAGCCCLGYQNLAELCFTTKAAMIKTVRQLSELGFIEINQREKFNRSNALKLTLESGLKRLRTDMGVSSGDDSYRYQNNTDKGYQNNTFQRYQNNTEGYLKDTLGYLKDTPHIDLKFKNLDLKNINARGEGNQNVTARVHSKDNEPDDVTSGRSMPNSGRAGSASEAEAEGSQLDIEDLCLWQDFKEEFPSRWSWFQLIRVQHQLLMRGIGKMGDDMLYRAWDEVSGWFLSRGFHVVRAEQNQRFSSEIVIKEAV